MSTTLTSTEILLDVIQSFAKQIPALARMGTEFRTNSLKLDQTYTAHIPTLPTISTYDTTTGYAYGANSARSLLTDVSVLVDQHKHVPIKFEHLNFIKDQKNRYAEVIANAGYVLAKAVIDSILAKVKSGNFSQASTFTEANCDFDMLNDVTGDLNGVGALNNGRAMIVNTGAASYLAADSRIASRDYAGQQPQGQGYRRFLNVGGFAEVVEYPDLPSNNGTALTGVTIEADDDLFTKTAHGLLTGDRFCLTAVTGGTGLTQGNYYYAIKVSATTFKAASTLALAIAGTGIDVTVDGSSVTVTPAENLVAFGFDRRAIAMLAGIPNDFSGLASQLGITQVMGFETVTDPESGITMAAVKWQAPGTGDLYWSPTLVWGSTLGRGLGTVAIGTGCDYAGHIVRSA
jgi:hypothetical protein